MQFKIKKIDFVLFLLCFILFKPYAIGKSAQQVLKIASLIIVILFISENLPRKKLINEVIPLCIWIFVASLIAFFRDFIDFEGACNGLLYSICIYVTYCVIVYCKDNEYYEGMISTFFKIFSLFSFISIISMMMQGHSAKGTEITYFFGSKFMTSYILMLWLMFFSINFNKQIAQNKMFSILHIIFIIMIIIMCKWLYCSTAVIGSAFFLIWRIIPVVAKKIATKPYIIIAAIVIAGLFPFYIDKLLSLEFVRDIIVNVLNETLTLTGRTKIFSNLFKIISQNIFLGYGYGNTIITQVVGYGNAQNATIQYIVDYGVIGLGILLLLVYRSFMNFKVTEKTEYLPMFIYAIVTCSTIEISFNYAFILVLFIINVFSENREKLYLQKGEIS